MTRAGVSDPGYRSSNSAVIDRRYSITGEILAQSS